MSKAITGAVSIDSGSSFMKAYNGGDPLMFPGVVREVFAPEEAGSGAITALGRRWLVGEAALRERADSHEPDRSRWFHGGDEQHVQICHALSRLGVTGKQKTLLLSLPYERAAEEAFQHRVSERKVFNWEDADGAHQVEFSRIKVIPQGVGALFHQYPEAPAQHMALMVDIGSCTTDIVAVRNQGDGWEFMRDACFSDQTVSTTAFFEVWHREVRRIAGFANKAFGYYDLMQRLMGDGPPTMVHQGEVIDLAPAAERAKVEFTRRLRAMVMGYAGPYWDELDEIILTGGGAHCINLDAWGDKRTQVLGPLANVLGQHTQGVDNA